MKIVISTISIKNLTDKRSAEFPNKDPLRMFNILHAEIDFEDLQVSAIQVKLLIMAIFLK